MKTFVIFMIGTFFGSIVTVLWLVMLAVGKKDDEKYL